MNLILRIFLHPIIPTFFIWIKLQKCIFVKKCTCHRIWKCEECWWTDCEGPGIPCEINPKSDLFFFFFKGTFRRTISNTSWPHAFVHKTLKVLFRKKNVFWKICIRKIFSKKNHFQNQLFLKIPPKKSSRILVILCTPVSNVLCQRKWSFNVHVFKVCLWKEKLNMYLPWRVTEQVSALMEYVTLSSAIMTSCADISAYCKSKITSSST